MKPREVKPCLSGFSLIELLIVTAILGVVIAAIAGSLLGGIRVYDVARSFNQGEGEAALAMEIIQNDLANAFDFFDLSFVGRGDSLVFPTVVEDPNGGGRAIAQVSYVVDDREKILLRKIEPYPDGEEHAEALLNRIETLELSYYSLVEGKGSLPVWQSAGEMVTGFPARVDITLSFVSDSGVGEMARTVLVPLKMSR